MTTESTSRADRSPSSLPMYVVAAVLTIANPLLHKSVSDVADWFSTRWGFARYDLVSLVAIPLASLIVAVPIIVKGRAFLFRSTTLAALGVLLVFSVAAQHWLLVVNVELVHLPQFALIAAILLAAGASGMAAFVLATLAGVVDETYQHLVIYADRPGTYFDINDIVLNALGAAWGVLVFAWLSPRARQRESVVPWPPRHWARAGTLGAAGVIAAWWWDPPVFDPLLRPSPAHPFYRVLSAPEGLVMCAAVAALVAGAWRRRPFDGNSAGVKAVVESLLIVIVTLSAGCAAAPRPRVAVATPPAAPPKTHFITTFWCGPPLQEFTDARAEEIVAAGFSIVGPPCEGPITPEGNVRALEVAARHGLSMWVADARYDERAPMRQGWEMGLDAAVASYRDSTALAGYFVTDEPSFQQFDALQAIVSRLRTADPAHVAYINLNPDYVFGPSADTAYPEYVARFLSVVGPEILSYDYYPFRVDGDRQTFFRSLALMRDAAERHSVPFLLIVLAMPHAAYRDPTEAELSWQAYHAVAYGAAGISYFAYWTPLRVENADVFRFRHGLIEGGAPTRHYAEAAALNLRLRMLTAELSAFHSIGVRDSAGAIASPLPFGPLASVRGGPTTVGFFEDATGTRMALLVNRDYKSAQSITLRMQDAKSNPERFDTDAQAWTSLAGDQVRLSAGGAMLLRWRSTSHARNRIG